ncbi:hypothetical protein POM88_034267 [Heracleum sosnowskyi]|uniref:Helicase C-terminal domain-containing protein n=1 Tax=Heracleum sosnowskyi TaxID=360622 RepID=A0AAD8MAE3_9APIA|nr:hypothetical protein POM88_034267 [Heracleum sosnowskyi]
MVAMLEDDEDFVLSAFLHQSDLFSPPQEVSDNAELVPSSDSSKMKMLILLEEPLKNDCFKVLRSDGSINAKKRVQVIKDFGPAPDGPAVLLARLKASDDGINLATANRVYFMGTWWNPEVEGQAMDEYIG